MPDDTTHPSERPGPPARARWRFEELALALPPPKPEGEPPKPEEEKDERTSAERALDRAWTELLILHTPFHPIEQPDYQRLANAFRQLESTFLDDDDLHPYYVESFRPEARKPGEEWIESPPGSSSAAGWKIHHVAALQAQLIEDVYYALRMDRYANSPDNRGWMNLFRRWGRSKTFNARFDTLRPTFTRDFEEFYDAFVRYHPPIDEQPVPHPWDPKGARLDTRPLPPSFVDDDSLRVQRKRTIPGVYLDSGIREASPQERQPPRATAGGHGAGGEKGETAGGASGETAAEGGSKAGGPGGAGGGDAGSTPNA